MFKIKTMSIFILPLLLVLLSSFLLSYGTNQILDTIKSECRASQNFKKTTFAYPEWYPAEGIMVAWLNNDMYFIDLVSAISLTTKCFIVVDNELQGNHVESILNKYDIEQDNIEMMVSDIDAIWVVDFSPFFVTDNGFDYLVDVFYNGEKNYHYSEMLRDRWNLPMVTVDLEFEGGNFMTDGYGLCFVTDQIYEDNTPELSRKEIDDIFYNYLGCNRLVVMHKLSDGTGHIDMFSKLIDPNTIIIGQYHSDDPEYDVLEKNAKIASSVITSNNLPFRVIRIPMPGNPEDYWTYTNSLIVNNSVIVPTYNADEDETALHIYQKAMPEYRIIGVYSSGPIIDGGAVHCTTKSIPRIKSITRYKSRLLTKINNFDL